MHAGIVFDKLDASGRYAGRRRCNSGTCMCHTPPLPPAATPHCACSGDLNRREFQAIVKELQGSLQFTPTPTPDELERVFNEHLTSTEPKGVFTRLDFIMWLMELKHEGRVRYTSEIAQLQSFGSVASVTSVV